uniref:Uncharacterized protein n=1 Tax=Triticum urartu TaxID=4572 RepID=A0A8R7QU93_TRIUA
MDNNSCGAWPVPLFMCELSVRLFISIQFK